MNKFLVFVFKTLIPFGILAYPIVASFETAWDYTIGSAGILLGFFAVKKMFKVFKEIEHKYLNEKIANELTKLTIIKYELSKLVKYAIVIAILAVTHIFIADIFKLIGYMSASYIIGVAIQLKGV